MTSGVLDMPQNIFTPNASRDIVSAATMSRLADEGSGVFVGFSSPSTVHQKRASVAWHIIASTNETK